MPSGRAPSCWSATAPAVPRDFRCWLTIRGSHRTPRHVAPLIRPGGSPICPKATNAPRRPPHSSEGYRALPSTVRTTSPAGAPFVRRPPMRPGGHPICPKATERSHRPGRITSPAAGPFVRMATDAPRRPPHSSERYRALPWAAPSHPAGSRTMNRAPNTLPSTSRRFSAAIRPRNPSTIWRLIERPRPECLPKPSPCGRSE
jgi:hypothetical protein